MNKLDETMKKLIAANSLGFVATVCDDGTPNLSPKGTCLVLDDEHVMFSEIRSPKTVANIKRRSGMEINFIDVFARKAVRIKGQAAYHQRDSQEYASLIDHFSQWQDLIPRMKGIVNLTVQSAKLITSPIYDDGAVEDEVIANWKQRFCGD